MKVCPECNTEYGDSVEFCEKDNTALESVSESAIDENVEGNTAETADFKVNETNAVFGDNAVAAERAPDVKTSVAGAAGAENAGVETTAERATPESAIVRNVMQKVPRSDLIG